MGPEHFWWGGWWIVPMVVPIVLLIAMCIALRLVFRRGWCGPSWWEHVGKHTAQGEDSETALEILQKRYARGEINKEEFEQVKKDLLS